MWREPKQIIANRLASKKWRSSHGWCKRNGAIAPHKQKLIWIEIKRMDLCSFSLPQFYIHWNFYLLSNEIFNFTSQQVFIESQTIWPHLNLIIKRIRLQKEKISFEKNRRNRKWLAFYLEGIFMFAIEENMSHFEDNLYLFWFLFINIFSLLKSIWGRSY